MQLMLWLIPASIGLTLIAVGAFIWAVRSAQFERLDRHALDILDDNLDPTGKKK
jgi:cbb3-type cytochrome oxidase maturation protein